MGWQDEGSFRRIGQFVMLMTARRVASMGFNWSTLDFKCDTPACRWRKTAAFDRLFYEE